jgi:spore maturation protein SpmB
MNTVVGSNLIRRTGRSFRLALPSALKTALWLLKITIPLSLAVTLLGYLGVVERVAPFLNPVFGLMGLPGEASLVFITSVFLNVYAAIAVIATLPLEVREITILAVMCLIAHNLVVESAVQHKTGTKVWHMVTLRLSSALVAGLALNGILPSHLPGSVRVSAPAGASEFWPMMAEWGVSAATLTLKIVLLVTLLMLMQQLLKEFGALYFLSRAASPLLRVFGLPPGTSFLWIVANLLGLAYGAAVMIEEVENGSVTRRDAELLNYHIAISHSNLEDVLLFAAIGAPVAWILVPRLVIAALAVWIRRWVRA